MITAAMTDAMLSADDGRAMREREVDEAPVALVHPVEHLFAQRVEACRRGLCVLSAGAGSTSSFEHEHRHQRDRHEQRHQQREHHDHRELHGT